MTINSKSLSQTSDISPVYVKHDEISDTQNIRLRHPKSNLSTQPEHVILNTGEDTLNEKEESHFRTSLKYKHKKSQILLLVLTTLSYFFYTLRSFIPDDIQTLSHNYLFLRYENFWSSIKPSPITRIYTFELRPDPLIENLLLRSAEIFQTFWLIYILTFIPRYTHLGYIYRNPSIFNRSFCFLLLFALLFQILSQTSLPPEIVSVCLMISLIFLIITSRSIAMKLYKYEEKLKSIDRLLIRYFVLNSLFLYTTSSLYINLCVSIECIAFHLQFDIPLITTIGLSIVLFVLIVYYLFDRLIYTTEFQSIYTPYIFLAIAFHFRLSHQIDDEWNFYYHWLIFLLIILLILIRLIQQLISRKKTLNYHHQISLENTKNENGIL